MTVAQRSYTIGMKIAVSIPDRVFADAEALAKRLGKSRSQLYADAVREYLRNHEADSVTDRINEAVAGFSPEGLESDLGFVRVAGQAVLRRNEWR